MSEHSGDSLPVTIPLWCAEELKRLAADLGWEQLRIELQAAIDTAKNGSRGGDGHGA